MPTSDNVENILGSLNIAGANGSPSVDAQMPGWMQVLEAGPSSMTEFAGWMAYRGSNTILKGSRHRPGGLGVGSLGKGTGGFARSKIWGPLGGLGTGVGIGALVGSATGSTGMGVLAGLGGAAVGVGFGRGMSKTIRGRDRIRSGWWNPRSFFRYPYMEAFSDAESFHSPYGWAHLGNRMTKGWTGRTSAKFAKNEAGWLGTKMGKAGLLGAPGEGTALFSPGLSARISAAERMSGRGFSSGLSKNVSELAKVGGLGNIAPSSLLEAQHLTLAAGKGTVSQMIGGYVAGVKGPLGESVSKAVEGAGLKTFSSWAEKGAAHAALFNGEKVSMLGVKSIYKRELAKGIGEEAAKKLALRGAAAAGTKAVGMAIPGVNVVMTAWMAYDLLKMTGTFIREGIVKPGIRLVGDAYKEYAGSINRPLLGSGGYIDTEAAASSRQRGVMAIQNSQLNARSVLGHEASMAAAHFG